MPERALRDLLLNGMYILFIFFLTSFAGIGTMLWHKWREIKQGKVDNELHSHKEIFSIQEVIKEFEKYYHHIPWGKFFLIIEKVISRGAFSIIPRTFCKKSFRWQ